MLGIIKSQYRQKVDIAPLCCQPSTFTIIQRTQVTHSLNENISIYCSLPRL